MDININQSAEYKNKKTLGIVLGSGGHSGEMIRILKSLPQRFQDLDHLLIYGMDDKISLSNFNEMYVYNYLNTIFIVELFKILMNSIQMFYVRYNNNRKIHTTPIPIYRARKVGQSYFTSIFSLIYSVCSVFFELLKIQKQPDLVNNFKKNQNINVFNEILRKTDFV